MPKSNKCNHSNNRKKISLTTKRDVQISNKPKIISTMPHPPETFKAIVIEETSTHIVSNIDSTN